MKERLSKQGTLLGPKQHDEYLKWRAARDKRIQNPRRLKTCKDDDEDEKPTPDTSSGSPDGK